MGIWIRTQNREGLVEVTGVGIRTIYNNYNNAEIVGLNKSLKKEHLRILQNKRKSIRDYGRNTIQII